MTPTDEISELLTRVALQDRGAFDRLYATVSAKLFGVLIRMLKDRELAEDTLQDVFIKIWQKADRFVGANADPMAWLIVVARNQAIDKLRVRREQTTDLGTAERMTDPDPSPEQLAVASGERARLANCLARLEPRRAEAVQAAYIEGYTYQELADRYGTPLNTMRTRLRRSLQTLKDCLAE
ncbi:sigma-70 family RNA polymerase sigma factor [Actibacterium sp. 188UL27-1]|uniref:sigma-70 family RNA polymerase sigma factor n=1 Tax=Actibacterium sp. 188UL27-1 TaxID=2786961 RepID=UPI001EF636CA|nr:sigma-70 family RNA polymerase sigma factor [Actibacterium sp. 188UL27-1]